MEKSILTLRAAILFCMTLIYLSPTFAALDTIPVKKYRKNVISGSFGVAIPFLLYASGAIHAEREIIADVLGEGSRIHLRGSLGGWGVWGGSGDYLAGSALFTFGRENLHFEIAIGAAAFYRQSRIIGNDLFSSEARFERIYNATYPTGGFALRLQKPGSHFVGKIGVSFPQAMYVTLGFAF